MVVLFIKIGYKKGRRHDYDIYKKIHPITPKNVVNVFDLGYLGIEKDFPQLISSIPNRKERNLQSSVEQKELNRGHAKKRIVIEHTICRLKKYRILAEVFRNRLNKHNRISDIVSGLVNYRIMKQQKQKQMPLLILDKFHIHSTITLKNLIPVKHTQK